MVEEQPDEFVVCVLSVVAVRYLEKPTCQCNPKEILIGGVITVGLQTALEFDFGSAPANEPLWDNRMLRH